MAMELIMPQSSMDSFDFHSARTSPHVSPPMTPRRFGESYFSAPTSPSRAAELYEEMSQLGMREDSLEFDFQFCRDVQIGVTLSSADDLFHGGKIRPMMLQPKSEIVNEKIKCSSISEQRRGRSAVDSPLSSHSSRRATRSLSPLRIGSSLEEKCDQQPNGIAKPASSSSSSVFRKWKLKDFLLFRSASEGRASDKYPLKKFAALRKSQEDGKSTSFRSLDSFGSDAGTRKKTQMSAHEVHYTKNKAASDSLKKKTYLPYKQGIFGRLF